MADDVTQSGEARAEPETPSMSADSEALEPPRRPRPRHGFLLRLFFLLLALVLLASNLVPLRDLLFVPSASLYFYAFARLVYPAKSHPPKSIFPRTSRVSSYVAIAGVLSVPVSAAYILTGDNASAASASPHLFLMTCQILTEIVVASVSAPVSLPVRAMVPIVYNARRLSTLAAWLESEVARDDGDGVSWFGRGIAFVNMALWTFNLFGFMLPVYLPMVMKMHYELERKHYELEHHN